MPKAISPDSIEGELITADEWNEDQFNKAEPVSNQAELAARYAAMSEGHGPATLEALRAQNKAALDAQREANKAALSQQQDYSPGFGSSILGGIFGGGGLF